LCGSVLFVGLSFVWLSVVLVAASSRQPQIFFLFYFIKN